MTHGSKWVFCGRREPHPAHGVVCPGTGKCGHRGTHDEHLVLTGSLAPFWCAGDRIRLYREGKVTIEDDRRKLLATTWAEEPLPVLILLPEGESEGAPTETIGRIDEIRRESGTGWVTGLLTLTGQTRNVAGLAAQAGFDHLGETTEVDGVMVMTGARLRAVTLGDRPCWNEMRIT